MEARSKLYTCEVISSIINLYGKCLAVQLISHSYGLFASVHIFNCFAMILFFFSISEIISIHKLNIPHGIQANIKFSRIK